MTTRLQTAAAAAAFALTLSVTAHAADAMRVVRDPVTGELRAPNAAEAAAFDKAETQLRAQKGKATPAAPVEIRYPDGTVETKLGDDTMMSSVVTSGADGTLTLHCLPAKEAQALVLRSSPIGKPAAAAAAKPDAKDAHAHR